MLTLAESSKIDYRHLMFINGMLPFLNITGLEFMESIFDDLV